MSRDRTARARIRQLLSTGGPIVDSSGFATGMLRDRINYSGSPVAFIQLIAAMEQEGEITREIRGKRTYKIRATAETADAFRPVATPAAGASRRDIDAGGAVLTIDYSELAKALVRELWTVVASVAASQAPREDSAGTSADEDYAHKLTAARQALDELFNDVESKARANASKV